jgi:PIN domain nuclease of toxin-antitoxin system
VSIDTLPPLHKDPFDRLLLAQALSEGVTFLTADAQLAAAAARGVDEATAAIELAPRRATD